MGRGSGDQASLFYEFRLDARVPKNHLLKRINVFVTAVKMTLHRTHSMMSSGDSPLILDNIQAAIEVSAVDQPIGGHPNVTGLNDFDSVRAAVDQPLGR